MNEPTPTPTLRPPPLSLSPCSLIMTLTTGNVSQFMADYLQIWKQLSLTDWKGQGIVGDHMTYVFTCMANL